MNKKPKSIFRDLYYFPYQDKFFKLSKNAKDDCDLVQRMSLLKTLNIHQGCVNTICWNDTGEYILSGSDDQHLIITDAHTYQVKTNYCTSHNANIFSAKFLPCSNDKQIVSCSGDGIILHTDLENTKETYHNQFNCHEGTTYEVITLPSDPNTFLSCGEDCSVRWFDLRTKTSCTKPHCRDDVLISCQRAVTALSVNPTASHQLAVGCADSTVRIFDRRYLATYVETHFDDEKTPAISSFIAPSLEDRRYRITSLSYSLDGQEILVSYSSDYLYLFKLKESKVTELKKPATVSHWDKLKSLKGKRERLNQSPPPVRRLRLRGDWSDTGPDARPERENTTTVSIGQARPQLHATLMQRMTDVLSQMLNDPMTRAVLSAGGEDSLDPEEAANRNQRTETNQNQPNQSNDPASQSTQPNNETVQPEASDEAGTSANTVESPVPTTSREEPNEPSEQQPSAPSTATSTTSEGRSTEQRQEESPACVTSLYGHLTRLRNLRDGFIEQHGTEPSVSLRYSPESTANATISLRVNDEVNRNAASGTSNNYNAAINQSTSGPSTSLTEKQKRIRDMPLDDDKVMITDIAEDTDDDDDFDDLIISEPAFKREQPDYGFKADMKMRYVGHRNARTMIKEATFWGDDYVMSGSDCGHVFIWDRKTAELKMLLQADQHVVNCLQPHPTLPLLATSGIDHDVKLWAPVLEESPFDSCAAQDLINRNAIMLEETRDTITVPAAFMIRMLACLNQIRRGARARTRRQEDPDQA